MKSPTLLATALLATATIFSASAGLVSAKQAPSPSHHHSTSSHTKSSTKHKPLPSTKGHSKTTKVKTGAKKPGKSIIPYGKNSLMAPTSVTGSLKGKTDWSGLPLQIHYVEQSGQVGYIPSFTLYLMTTAVGRPISSVKVTPQDFNTRTDTYNVVLPDRQGFHVGSTLHLVLGPTDGSVVSLRVNYDYFSVDHKEYSFTTAVHQYQYATFNVGAAVDLQSPQHHLTVFYPSQQAPLSCILNTLPTRTGFDLTKVTNDAPLVNQALTLEFYQGKSLKVFTLHTNSYGVVWFPTKLLPRTYFKLFLPHGDTFATTGKSALALSSPISRANNVQQTEAETYKLPLYLPGMAHPAASSTPKK